MGAANIAIVYAGNVRAALTDAEWSAVVVGAAVPNDYYDANVSLAEAFERVTGREPDMGSDADKTLCAEAYALARAAHYFGAR